MKNVLTNGQAGRPLVPLVSSNGMLFVRLSILYCLEGLNNCRNKKENESVFKNIIC